MPLLCRIQKPKVNFYFISATKKLNYVSEILWDILKLVYLKLKFNWESCIYICYILQLFPGIVPERSHRAGVALLAVRTPGCWPVGQGSPILKTPVGDEFER